jgi:beta-galactosidase
MRAMTKAPAFCWGTATAAYQIEGAWLTGGKGLSIWDAFAHTPGKVDFGHTGDVACDHFHRFAEDIALMQQLGVNAYRFSIAWPRIFPQGRGEVSTEGVAFYSRLIDELVAAGITPFITLYHWDLPLTLQLEQDGWLSRQTAEDFAHYARYCFEQFADRVHHWITFNESWCTAVLGYGIGFFPPGRKNPDEPYIVGHNLLIAHGLAVEAFRAGGFAGQIGLASNCDWREPLTDSAADIAAAQRSLEFFYGWFTDPVVSGDYPAVMRERLGERLPTFSAEDQQRLKGSVDFLGLNHYTSHFASAAPSSAHAVAPEDGNGGMADDQAVYLSCDPAWPRTDMGWFVVPWGFRKMLNWVNQRYPNLPIYVTENGCANPHMDEENCQQDTFRVNFLSGYLNALQQAKDEDSVPVMGYFCWSLLDNFEWAYGYSKRFGLIHCDFASGQRTPKQSFYFYQNHLRKYL